MEGRPEYATEAVEFQGHLLRDGFAPVPHTIIRTSALGAYDKLILILLLSRADRDGITWPGQQGLAESLGISRRTVLRALARLRDLGIVSWSRRGQGQTNLYTIHENALAAFIAQVTTSHSLRRQTVTSRCDTAAHKEEPVEEEPYREKERLSSRVERRVSPITPEYIDELVLEFSPHFGGNGRVRELIEDAMNHKAIDKRKDKRLYLRTWLRNDVARQQNGTAKKHTGPGRIGTTVYTPKSDTLGA